MRLGCRADLSIVIFAFSYLSRKGSAKVARKKSQLKELAGLKILKGSAKGSVLPSIRKPQCRHLWS